LRVQLDVSTPGILLNATGTLISPASAFQAAFFELLPAAAGARFVAANGGFLAHECRSFIIIVKRARLSQLLIMLHRKFRNIFLRRHVKPSRSTSGEE
jgi:hypothetical protein